MIPPFIDRALSSMPGAVGAYYNAYKTYRWGDPYLRIIGAISDRSRLSVDVGAHLGDYTFFMRRHAAACLAFECNPALVAHLKRRFGRSVDIRPDAASDHEGTTTLRIPKSSVGKGLGRATIEANNALADFADVDVLSVHTVRLDDVVNRPVGLIKIDVEGHELAVLQGARRILAQDKPNLIVEIEERHAPGCVAAVFEFLSGFGYRGFFLRDGGLVPVPTDTPVGDGLWNYVFKHRDRG